MAPQGSVEFLRGLQGSERLPRRSQLTARHCIGGLALDVCVFNTVMDAIRKGYRVFVMEDASRAINRKPGDGAEAITVMQTAGAAFVTLGQLV